MTNLAYVIILTWKLFRAFYRLKEFVKAYYFRNNYGEVQFKGEIYSSYFLVSLKGILDFFRFFAEFITLNRLLLLVLFFVSIFYPENLIFSFSLRKSILSLFRRLSTNFQTPPVRIQFSLLLSRQFTPCFFLQLSSFLAFSLF